MKKSIFISSIMALVVGLFYFYPLKRIDSRIIDRLAHSMLVQQFNQRLQPGDLILRTTNDYISQWIVRNLNQNKLKVSHIGVVYRHKETRNWHVIHIIGDSTSNRIQSTPLSEFLLEAKIESLFIMRLKRPAGKGQVIAQGAREYLQKNAVFDYGMNTYDDEKLYCTELVYHVLRGINADNALKMQGLGPRQVISFRSFFNQKYFRRVWPVK